jgi:hypothetical protein
MGDLKIYQYWVDKRWDTEHSLAIIAKDKKEADAIYKSHFDEDRFDWSKIKSKEHKIESNMIIAPCGYDEVDLVIKKQK